jgi:hypothetical protein
LLYSSPISPHQVLYPAGPIPDAALSAIKSPFPETGKGLIVDQSWRENLFRFKISPVEAFFLPNRSATFYADKDCLIARFSFLGSAQALALGTLDFFYT